MKNIRGHIILEHPSDIGIEAKGGSLAEAFEEAASGMMSIILDVSTVQPVEQRPITLHANDPDQLLVKWLTELLYLYDGQQFVSCEFHIEHLRNNSLSAIILGEQLRPGQHQTLLDVKAVTYHQLLITENERGATVRVFLDI